MLQLQGYGLRLPAWLCDLRLKVCLKTTQRCNCNSSRHTCTTVTLAIYPQSTGCRQHPGSRAALAAAPAPGCPGKWLRMSCAEFGLDISTITVWFNFSQWWNWTKILALRMLEKWGNLILNPFSLRQVFLKLLLKSLMFSQGVFPANESLRLPETRSHFFTAKQADNKLRALTKSVQNFLPWDALLDKRIKSCHSPLTEQPERKREPNWPLGN